MSCSAMRWGAGGAHRRGGWRPFELAAMIGGFVLFWPIGLAILAAKGWREGWWGPNARSGEEGGPRMPWQGGAWKRGGWQPSGWGFGEPEQDWRRELNRDSGNLAFEDYKAEELKRMQAEFERLAADQRAFGDHIEALRRAKDKAEFDSFIASRRSGQSSGSQSSGGPISGGNPQPNANPGGEPPAA
jgi:hypothetical protein